MTQEEIEKICDLLSACLAVLAFNDNPSLEPGLPSELVDKVKKAVTGVAKMIDDADKRGTT